MTRTGCLLVTGGSSGIGQAIRTALIGEFLPEHTANIDVHDPNNPVDVRDYDAVLETMTKVVVPNCTNYLFSGAGVVFFIDPHTKQPVDFAAAPITQLRAMAEINFIGQINVLHAFIQTVLTRKAQGNIVVVSSISAFYSGGPNMAVYDATKAAISALAKRLVPYKDICINIIDPGSVRTGIGSLNPDFTHSCEGAAIVKQGQDADDQRLGHGVSLKQIEEVTRFLFFADHGINGAEIVIDGGLTLLGRESY